MDEQRMVSEAMRVLASRRWAKLKGKARSEEMGRVSRAGWASGKRPRAKKT